VTGYLAECALCGWRSAAADTDIIGANLAVQHLATVHPSEMTPAGVSQLRVWTFEALTATVLTGAPGANVEPETPAAPIKKKR
jgi:hypothetical protein